MSPLSLNGIIMRHYDGARDAGNEPGPGGAENPSPFVESDSSNTCLFSHLLFCFFDKATSAPAATLEETPAFDIFRRSRQLTSRFTAHQYLSVSRAVCRQPVTRECSEMASSSWEIYRDAVSEGLLGKSDFSRGRSGRPRWRKILHI